MIDQFDLQANNSQKLEKSMDAVAKSVFKSNGSESFKGTIRKYFGAGTHNIV